MSSSLIKAYNVNYGKTNSEGKKKSRIIDSNDAVSERIRVLSEMLEEVSQESFADDFTEGLDAEMVDALLVDQDEVEAVNEANNEAYEKVIAQANEEAQTILENAQNSASSITDEARTQAESIKEEARRAGHDEGYNEGYAKGMEEADALKSQLSEEKIALEKEYEDKIAELEPLFVNTLTDIYSHVFGVDLADRNDVVLHLLKNAIRNVNGSRSFLIHVSREDRARVEEEKSSLSEGLGSSCVMEIIEDMTLSAGNSFIETDGGIFDCALGTELELLKKELRLLAYSDE